MNGHPGQAQIRHIGKQQHAAHDGNDHIQDVSDVVQDRPQRIGILVGAFGHGEEFFIQPVKVRLARLLVAEDLDDLLAVEHFQQRSGNAQPLLLPAGHIGAALLDVGIVARGELRNELVRAGQPAGLHQFLVHSLRIAPAEVFPDRSGKQNVLLQHHRHLIAQRFQIVIAHVRPADPDDALRHVIQAGNQLDQRGFGGAGAADDADGLARPDVQVDILQRHPLRLRRIFEADMLKGDGAICDVVQRVLRICERARFRQHLHNALTRFVGHQNHHEHHGQHHQAVEHHEAVRQQGGKLPHVQIETARSNDGVRPEGQNKNHHRVNAKLHHRPVQCQNPLCSGEIGTDLLRCGVEFFLLVVLPNKRFDHAHGFHIFLNGSVQPVILLEHLFEQRHSLIDHKPQSHGEQR